MTHPSLAEWPASDPRFRRSERSAPLGRGAALWGRARHDVLRWRVKTASGFRIDQPSRVSPGQRLIVRVRVMWFAVAEPVEVVEVVDEPDRAGFSYRTLPGHPVHGEEAFIVHREGDEVRFTVRSLTRAAPDGFWRWVHPLLRIAQVIARRRYLRALRG